MKLKHWVFVAFVVIGVLYVVHIKMSHGGFGSFKSGLGLR